MGGKHLETFYTVPNQKIIVTVKAKADTENIYSKDNISAVLQAMRTLTDRAYKLFMRMNLNKNGFTYPLSPALIKKDTGMSETRYREAVKELIKKGFLKQSDKQKNVYYFCEYPEAAYINNDKSICTITEGCISNLGTPSIRNDVDHLHESKGEIIYNTTINNKKYNNDNEYVTGINNLDELSNILSDSDRFKANSSNKPITPENDDVMPWEKEDY